MVDQLEFGHELFVALEQIDEKIARRVAAERCLACGGPLHRGNYARKPRGGLIAPKGEPFVTRFSLCCGREGCRKRMTPPSLRFLGRRVYLGMVVIVASLLAQALEVGKAIRQATGVPARTVRRWLSWWRGPFIRTEVFVAVRARLGGVTASELPVSIVLRLAGSLTQQVLAMLEWLLPLTASPAGGSRLSRDMP